MRAETAAAAGRARRARGFGEKAAPAAPRPLPQNKHEALLADGVKLYGAALELLAQGQTRASLELLKKAQSAMDKAEQGRPVADVARICVQMAAASLELHDLSQAAELYEKALEVFAATLGTEHLDYARCLSDLARLRRSERNFAAAEAHLKEAMAVYSRHLDTAVEQYIHTIRALASVYMDMGRVDNMTSLLHEHNQVIEVARNRGVWP